MQAVNTLIIRVCSVNSKLKHLADGSTEMNLSHVITEFSFGPYFPDITQPLDNSFELTHDRESMHPRTSTID